MKKTLLALAVLVVVGIVALLYAPARTEHGPISEKDGLYYVGDKTLGAGYLIENGVVLYTSRLQFATGTSTYGVRYDKFPVAYADAKSFAMILDAASNNSESTYYEWAKDAAHIFYEGDAVQPLSSSTPIIDTSTFSVIPSQYYPFGKDVRAVYELIYRSNDAGTGWAYQALEGVDPATFAFVEQTCAEDKNSFYTIGYYGEFAATSTELAPSQCVRPGPGESQDQ